ncbi:MAG: CHASE4 domain-containing protein, partial [Pseudomonadota bacterium]
MSRTVDPTDVRFSRRLVVFHILALVALMSVTATIVFWISTQHNQLARSAAHKMVSAGVNSILGRVSSTVLDYSIWTEAYESILKSDLDWMYNNMGSGAAEIGAVDLIVLINPQSGAEHGWQAGTPMPGETGLIPPELLAKVLALLEKPTDEDGSAPTMFARMNGEIWAFAVTRVVPTEGSLGTEALQQAPIQIHGLRFSETLLTGSIGDRFLIDNVHLEPPGNAGAGSIALRGAEGTTIADLTWTPPSPGQRILEQIAIPLMAAMAIAGIFGALLSS